MLFYSNEVWLSLVEQYVRDVWAAGSNPVTSTIFFLEDPARGGSRLQDLLFFVFWGGPGRGREAAPRALLRR